MSDQTQFASWVRKILGEKEFAAVLDQPITKSTEPPIQIYSENSKQNIHQKKTKPETSVLSGNLNTPKQKNNPIDLDYGNLLFGNDQDLNTLYELVENSPNILDLPLTHTNNLKYSQQALLQSPNNMMTPSSKFTVFRNTKNNITTKSPLINNVLLASQKNISDPKNRQYNNLQSQNINLDNQLLHLQNLSQDRQVKKKLNINSQQEQNFKKKTRIKQRENYKKHKKSKKSQKFNEKKIILDFLMQPLNLQEATNRENPAMGVVFYLHLKTVIKTSLKNGSTVSKYQLMPNADDPLVRRGKCSVEMATWIYERKFFNKDFVKKKRKRGRRTLEKLKNEENDSINVDTQKKYITKNQIFPKKINYQNNEHK
ncbi:hypothetical protein M0812_30269 [Anaeramoeba flamelloides]|uniref:Uncharacterized protein n=1 Tax=Anaeramoeba flamelloides TaxID=1746091 RepID=A0AAV7Y538_9EUKA|nr:hypothetical protein M0812_30269 [Anaeramoeba flamelloides]